MPGGRNKSRTHRDFLIRSPSIILPETGEYVMRDGVLIKNDAAVTWST